MMRLFSTILGDLKPVRNVFITDRILYYFRDLKPVRSIFITDRIERGQVKTKAGIRGMWPQAKEHLKPPEAGRGRKDAPSEPLEGLQLC